MSSRNVKHKPCEVDGLSTFVVVCMPVVTSTFTDILASGTAAE